MLISRRTDTWTVLFANNGNNIHQSKWIIAMCNNMKTSKNLIMRTVKICSRLHTMWNHFDSFETWNKDYFVYYSFKDSALGFIDLFFFLISTLFSIIFINSFFLLTLGFVCSFSGYFKWYITFFIKIFLVFWGKSILLWTSKNCFYNIP